MKGGLLGARVLTVRDVKDLADVPPRDVLLARLAGGFQAPLVRAAGLFQAFTRNIAYGLKALVDRATERSRAAEAAAAAAEPATDEAAPEATSRPRAAPETEAAATEKTEKHTRDDAPETERKRSD